MKSSKDPGTKKKEVNQHMLSQVLRPLEYFQVWPPRQGHLKPDFEGMMNEVFKGDKLHHPYMSPGQGGGREIPKVPEVDCVGSTPQAVTVTHEGL